MYSSNTFFPVKVTSKKPLLRRFSFPREINLGIFFRFNEEHETNIFQLYPGDQ